MPLTFSDTHPVADPVDLFSQKGNGHVEPQIFRFTLRLFRDRAPYDLITNLQRP
jgi:hypothetical protein